MLVDPDGMEAEEGEWKPVKGLKNVWKAEENDNAQTVAKDAGISLAQAKKTIANHPGITEGGYVAVGNIGLDEGVNQNSTKTVEKATYVAGLLGNLEKPASTLKHGGGYIALSVAKTGKGLYWKPYARGLNNLIGVSVNVSKVLKGFGYVGFGVGVAYDGYNYYNGKITGAKFTLNTFIGAYGLTAYGKPASIIYFGTEAFYPGGFPAAMRDHAEAVKNYNKLFEGTGMHYRSGGGL